jgi:glycosyltransferase involved in cell wall biosynthesis
MRESKIWIISEYYYPVVTSTGYYITEIAEFLAKKNKNINVICTSSKYYDEDDSKFVSEEFLNGVKIYRIKSSNLNKNNFLLRTIKLFSSSIFLFFKILHLVNKRDQVLIVTNPVFLILLMPILKLLKGFEYKILVHDIFPENLSAIGKLGANSFLYKILKFLFDFSYSSAELCIAIGRDMKEVLVKKIGDSSKICIIPNWSDIDDVKPFPKESTKIINKFKLQDKFVFQFAGNLGFAQGLENIIEAIKLVNNDNLHFLFIGSGALENQIEQYANQEYVTNVTKIGFQKRSDQIDFLNACDVAIVTLSDGMYGLGVPSKSYNIMAADKPILIIADPNSEISICVNEYNIGWVVKPNDPYDLSVIFQKIYLGFITKNESFTNSSREVAINLFSKEMILEKYLSLFN